MDIKPKKIEVVPVQNLIPNIEPETIQPRSTNQEIETVNILNRCNPIDNLDKLREKLIELGIRFNTDPKVYQKRDYWLLICILYRALIHLYEINPETVIVTEWLNPHSDNYVPTEKLVAETIEELGGKLDQEILDRIQAVADEADLRLQVDQDLSDSLDREIRRLEGLIRNINDLIPNEASSSNQLADKDFVQNQIATNASNFRGSWSNWVNVPTSIEDYPADYTGNKKPNNNDYLIIQDATGYNPSNTGIWRFYYQGDWDTLGKSGWEAQYRVEQAFTPEQLNAINSGITSQKVGNYDNYRQEIDDLFPLIAAGL